MSRHLGRRIIGVPTHELMNLVNIELIIKLSSLCSQAFFWTHHVYIYGVVMCKDLKKLWFGCVWPSGTGMLIRRGGQTSQRSYRCNIHGEKRPLTDSTPVFDFKTWAWCLMVSWRVLTDFISLSYIKPLFCSCLSSHSKWPLLRVLSRGPAEWRGLLCWPGLSLLDHSVMVCTTFREFVFLITLTFCNVLTFFKVINYLEHITVTTREIWRRLDDISTVATHTTVSDHLWSFVLAMLTDSVYR